MATENTPAFNKVLYAPLADIDPVVKNIIDKETWRQFSGIELIASENLTMLTNKYSEGLPGARYYGGNEYIDELEVLCRKRALQAFNLDPEKWGVQRTALLGQPSLPYGLDPSTQLIDYAGLRKQAKTFKPRLIICAGLVAAQQLNSPFDYCDVVTTTTHKTLRGARKTGANYEDLEKRVNDCRGPHNNTIAAVATALLQVSQPEYKEYARRLGSALLEYGYKLQTGGTDNHLVLWDLRPLGLTGSKVEKVCDLLGITINNIKVVASFLHRAVQLSILLQKEAGTKMLKDFVRVATTETEGKVGAKMVKELRQEVVGFARKWPLPGVDVTRLQRPAGIEEDF
ncbi:glycine hydroxymethyltransferase [Pisolithus microcarpus]|nr:glycine hydroxymethyltransferase [Pisolithus microcarpus]